MVLSEVVIRNLENVPLTLMTARAAHLMRGMLDRGFTSVRDTGGADWGLKEATDKGLLPGPRLFIAGRAIGPTGGHSDGRRRTDFGSRCHCCNAMSFSMGVADGITEVRRAVREEMRQGCDQVKIMMSGGVASPYDPLDSLQFSVGEVEAAVQEAHAFGRYVCAHAYTPQAITRAAHAGVRTIEHGNLIDDASAKLMAEKGMFLVANLVTYFEMKKHAAEYGMSSDMLAKNDLVIDGALKSLEICKRHGVPVAYGTDLLGQLQVAQSQEFTLRAQVLSPAEIIRSATTIGAQVMRMEGKIGCLKPGAFADLLRRRRQSAQGPETVQGRRPAPFGHHEGRTLPQEPAALMSQQILFRNFELLEPSFGELRGGYQLLVEGDTIRELSDKPIKAAEAEIIDCGGRTLMPGLIDCHVHAIHSEVNVRFMEMLPLTLVTARAATRLRAMLDRGFTTVRDTGGADWGIKTAIETGHITGPRLYIAGQSIGPTGGHSDSRRRTNRFGSSGECVCCNGLQFKSAIADGVDEVRKSAREQMRQGADHVKIMMSGGVASPYDPLDSHAILRRRSQRGGGRGDRLRPLRLRPRLFRRIHHPRRAARRPHHRARQSDRRCLRQADGRERACSWSRTSSLTTR